LWEEEGPTEDEVLEWTLQEFNAYCKSKEFHDNDAKYQFDTAISEIMA
jgi:hypothetical protein